jgi:hypothetical protein
MNDAPGSDTPWWLEAREQGLERKTLKARQQATAAPGDTFLVVTEGIVTEPVYFETLLERRELARVWVTVTPGDHSDPRRVIQTAKDLAQRQRDRAKRKQLAIDEPEEFDHVWAVIDTDVAVRDGFWNDLVQRAQADGVKLAHSTPCFEFWLLLHISGFTTRSDLVNGEAAKRAVKEALKRDYSTNEKVARMVFPSFVGKWPEAVGHAARVRRHHDDAGTRLPANPSTDMDQLLRALNDAAPEHLRRLKP